MYRRVSVLILIAIVALYIGAGCNKGEIANLKEQNAGKDSTILGISTEASNLRAQLTEQTLKSAVLLKERNDLAQRSDAEHQEVARLQSAITQLKAKAAQDLKEFADATVVFHDRQTACEAIADTLRRELAVCSATTESCASSLSALQQHATDVDQWREYWKKEAHRNWWKKFWGAGKVPPPAFPEPTQ